jgi:hypothetical protein
MVRLGSCCSIFGTARFFGGFVKCSAMDCMNLGSSCSMRSYGRLGSALSMFDYLSLGSCVSVRTFARLGSSLSVAADGKIYDAHVTNILTVSDMAQCG